MKAPNLSNEKIIDLLAEGYNGPEIRQMYNMKKSAWEQRMLRLKKRHNCRTATQLVVKLKLSNVSTTQEQPKY
jgi:hypothetical protein